MSQDADHWTSQMTTRLGPSGWEIVPMSPAEKPLSSQPVDGPQGFLAQRAIAHLRNSPECSLQEGDALPTISVTRWPGSPQSIQVGTTPTLLYQCNPENPIGSEAILLRNLGPYDVYLAPLDDLYQDTRSGLLLRGHDRRSMGPYELYLAAPPPEVFGVTQQGLSTVMVVPF